LQADFQVKVYAPLCFPIGARQSKNAAMRRLSLFAGFVMLLGAGFTALPHHADGAATGPSNDELLTRAYDRVQTGMPVSQLGQIGLDTTQAEHLSKLALMENYMPKDTAAFDALDPAVQACYFSTDCNAYIFTATGTQALLLVEGGKVAWKTLAGVTVA
jgi:hypothetical protein